MKVEGDPSWVIVVGSGTAPGTSLRRLWSFLVSILWLEREFLSQLVQWLCSNLCRALRKMGMKHIHVAWVHTEPFTRVAVGR